MTKTRYTFYLDDDLRVAIQARAVVEDRSVANLINRAIREALARGVMKKGLEADVCEGQTGPDHPAAISTVQSQGLRAIGASRTTVTEGDGLDLLPDAAAPAPS